MHDPAVPDPHRTRALRFSSQVDPENMHIVMMPVRAVTPNGASKHRWWGVVGQAARIVVGHGDGVELRADVSDRFNVTAGRFREFCECWSPVGRRSWKGPRSSRTSAVIHCLNCADETGPRPP